MIVAILILVSVNHILANYVLSPVDVRYSVLSSKRDHIFDFTEALTNIAEIDAEIKSIEDEGLFVDFPGVDVKMSELIPARFEGTSFKFQLLPLKCSSNFLNV